MTTHPLRSLLLSAAFGLGLIAPSAQAAEDPALAASIRKLQTRWETIKFTVPEGDAQTRQMNALGDEADALAARYPDRPSAQIWDGIITSERASMASAFSALGLAKRARDILEKANAADEATLDAGAPTSLGVLYYGCRVSRLASGTRRRRDISLSTLFNSRRTASTPSISTAIF